MSQETLLTAARRAVRFFNIDMRRGGIITTQTEMAFETLNTQVLIDSHREKQNDAAEENKNPDSR